jgi:hypothetical protein
MSVVTLGAIPEICSARMRNGLSVKGNPTAAAAGGPSPRAPAITSLHTLAGERLQRKPLLEKLTSATSVRHGSTLPAY